MSEGEETIEMEAQDLEPGQWVRYRPSAFSEVYESFEVESIESWELAPEEHMLLKVKDMGGNPHERFFHRTDMVEVKKDDPDKEDNPDVYPRWRIVSIEDEEGCPSVGE